jgi:hypothetical protein
MKTTFIIQKIYNGYIFSRNSSTNPKDQVFIKDEKDLNDEISLILKKDIPLLASIKNNISAEINIEYSFNELK